MKNENPTEDKKGLLFNQCGLNIIQFKGERRKRHLCSPRTEKNNSMSSLPKGCLSNKEIFYLIKGILTLHQPF